MKPYVFSFTQRGFIFLSDDTWEVLPLTSRLEALLDSEDDPDWSRHIVKRVSSPRGSFDDAIRGKIKVSLLLYFYTIFQIKNCFRQVCI